MKILITDANGFMGKNFIYYLQDKMPEAKCFGLVGKDTPLTDIENYCEKIFTVEPEKIESFAGICQEIDLVVHFSALAKNKPQNFYLLDSIFTDHLLLEATKSEVKRFIFVSSPAVFGFGEQLNGTENLPYVFSELDYANAKIVTEQKMNFYTEKFNLNTTTIYPGPFVYGEEDLFNSISLFQMAEDGILPENFSKEKMTGSCYIKNLCYGIFLAIKKENSESDKFIINDGEKISWEKIVDCFYLVMDKKKPSQARAVINEKISRIAGTKSPFSDYLTKIIGENLCFSSEKAVKELGYKPIYSFYEGLVRTARWYKQLEND